MSRRTPGKKALFRIEHPNCCFCGGTRPATTRDHVPPKACFPRGLCPEEFEFPSCAACNNGHSKHDTIFGFYSMLLDFNEENRTPDDHKRMEKLRDEIAKRYPDALPDPATHEPIHRAGNIITPSPVAFSAETTPVVKAAMLAVGGKLAHALYYREMKRFLTSNHRFFTSAYQLQRLGTEDLTAYFKRMLPDFRIGRRPNIAKYGNRFGYMSGCKPEEDFFLFAAQFGYGLVVWGIARPADMELNESNDALRKMNWRNGGCGLGANVP